MALYESDIPDRKVIMRKGAFVLDPVQTDGANPFLVEGRLTTRDFFAMFDTPFLYGGGWDEAADASSQMVVVLSKRRTTRRSAAPTASAARCASTAATSSHRRAGRMDADAESSTI